MQAPTPATQEGATAPAPDETFEMTFVKDNAALDGFNKWTINGVAYPLTSMMAPASFHLKEGQRYRLHMRNASDDIHPVHLHRHSFELTNLAGTPTAGVIKDVVMLGGYQQDRPFVLMADRQCRIVGRLVDASGRLLLRHNCTGTSGASGAPLLIDTGGRWHLAAIDAAAEMGIAGGAGVVPIAPREHPW